MKKPTIAIFVGAPLFGGEARFLNRLHADLADTEAIILANFVVGERQIDFAVVTPAHAAILELKNFSGPIFGSFNGAWTYRSASGKKTPCPGASNPYQQTLEQKFKLSDAMRQYQHRNPAVPGPMGSAFYSDFAAFVCVFEGIHAESRVTPGDHKVKVRSYADVLEELQTRAQRSSWNLPDWRAFAENHLNLTTVTLGEAIDVKVFASCQTVRLYRDRVKAILGTHLAPLFETSGNQNYGQTLISSALEPRNHLLVGPSGSAKSFHLNHLAIRLADSDEEAPVLVEAKRYRGGDFGTLLKQTMAPFHAGNPGDLLQGMRLCGVRPVLMIDALNECSDAHLHDLLMHAQAFTVAYDARIVVTSQTEILLPADLTAEVHHLPLPDGVQKRLIFAHHAGVEPTPELDTLCEGFTNAYDLTVAGRCHRSGAAPQSRIDLYDRYVRKCVGERRILVALLRHIAAEMSNALTIAWSRDAFETTAEAFLKDKAMPLSLADDLHTCRLIKLTDDYFSFEHELLFDYFKAEAIRRQFPDIHLLGAELTLPRNQELLELIVPRYSKAPEIAILLSSVRDAEVLSRILAGHCGPTAGSVVFNQCLAILHAAAEDVPNVELYCGLRALRNGRISFDGIAVKGNRDWTEYDALLCEVIARNLDRPEFQRTFLELLDTTEWKLRAEAHNAAKQVGIPPADVWEDTLRTFGGLAHHLMLQIPCVSILSRLRMALMHPPRYAAGLPIRDALLERIRRNPQSHFSLLMLLQDHQVADNRDKTLKTLELVEQGLKSGLYILQVQAAQCLQFMQHVVRNAFPEKIPEIHEMLNSVTGDNLLLNSAVLEALAAYDGIRISITTDDALQEMRSLIAPNAASDPQIIKVAKMRDTSPTETLAGFASGCLGKVFEDVFQGVYLDAYYELSTEEKETILCLASQASDGFEADWILRELHRHGGRRALSVYQRFAAGIQKGTCFADEAVANFVLGIEGCALWSDVPPPYNGGDSPEDRAWATIGEIVFWHFRERAARADDPRFTKLWDRLRGPVCLAAADVLYRIMHTGWRVHKDDRPDIDLVSKFANQIRVIAEICLAHRDSLSSIFAQRGSADAGLVQFLIETLGRVGSATSIPILQAIVDDRQFGRHAIGAIQLIQKTLFLERELRLHV